MFSLLFIDREPTTWPVNNCLQISVLLQIIFCSYVLQTTFLCENGRLVPELSESDFVDQKIDKTIIDRGYHKI